MKSRLIREDENDLSDEDEKRINMSCNLEAQDRDQRRQNFFNEEAEAEPEDDEWENQQIRKGVTGVPIVPTQPAVVSQDIQQVQPSLFTNVIAPQNKELPSPQTLTQKLRER